MRYIDKIVLMCGTTVYFFIDRCKLYQREFLLYIKKGSVFENYTKVICFYVSSPFDNKPKPNR